MTRVDEKDQHWQSEERAGIKKVPKRAAGLLLCPPSVLARRQANAMQCRHEEPTEDQMAGQQRQP